MIWIQLVSIMTMEILTRLDTDLHMSNLLLMTMSPLLIAGILFLSSLSGSFLRLSRIVFILFIPSVGTVWCLQMIIITLSRP